MTAVEDNLEYDIETLTTALRLFVQTMKRPQQWASITKQAGISIDRPAASILQTLLLHQPLSCRVQDLAAHLGIEPPSVTRKTQELERLGYLRRSRDEHDRRAIGLVVTPRGQIVAERLWKAQQQAMSNALEDWTAADRHQFASLFERFSTDLAAIPATHMHQRTNQQGANYAPR
jgi:DNA-binding MarR family transcriptional regulator